ncbi:hypothetical protein TNCV_5062961 [Trichonephila clavipes]|nr:hypothetical protein TNCV_5062961 [Trichonephila clavipes]
MPTLTPLSHGTCFGKQQLEEFSENSFFHRISGGGEKTIAPREDSDYRKHCAEKRCNFGKGIIAEEIGKLLPQDPNCGEQIYFHLYKSILSEMARWWAFPLREKCGT